MLLCIGRLAGSCGVMGRRMVGNLVVLGLKAVFQVTWGFLLVGVALGILGSER